MPQKVVSDDRLPVAQFTPWKVILSTLTLVYANRNLDSILGITAPEPLARLYSRSYYRATWVAVALDAGFASSMHIQTKWLRDISSVLFSLYYLVYAHEADEKLRKYRATCTVETLRVTWEKMGNPYVRSSRFTSTSRRSPDPTSQASQLISAQAHQGLAILCQTRARIGKHH
ncbi:hypothetical protein FRC16_010699 [Serendipita sp. 398]|nr:hypothetical protein FRC16_010699 [Serendipita sp. 398]